MAKLPKSIIKKYGISKKAWAVFRGTKTTKRTRTTKSKSVKTMARRRGRFKRFGRSRNGGMKLNVMSSMAGGAAYGILRPMAGNAIQNIMPNFANGYEDELVIGGLALLGAWKGRGMIKAQSHHVLFTESARVAGGVAGNAGSSNRSGVTYYG